MTDVQTERERDAETLATLADKYRATAAEYGVDAESVTIGEALQYLRGELQG